MPSTTTTVLDGSLSEEDATLEEEKDRRAVVALGVRAWVGARDATAATAGRVAARRAIDRKDIMLLGSKECVEMCGRSAVVKTLNMVDC